MICFNRSFEKMINVEQLEIDQEGRFTIVIIQIPKVIEFLLANIYAPNEDDASFFINIFQKLETKECYSKVIGGDFNVALNPVIDQTTKIISHKNSREVILNFLEEAEMWDIWCSQNFRSRRIHMEKIFSQSGVVQARLFSCLKRFS